MDRNSNVAGLRDEGGVLTLPLVSFCAAEKGRYAVGVVRNPQRPPALSPCRALLQLPPAC